MKREQLIQKLRKEAKEKVIPSGDISPVFEKIIRKQLGLQEIADALPGQIH